MIEVQKWLSLALATLALYVGSVSAAGALCVRGHTWWDRQRGACVPCTRCEPARRLAVRTPCEPHRDATCSSLYDLDIWPFTLQDNDTEPPSPDYYGDYADDTSASASEWVTRTPALTLAASGCVIFFVVVLSLSYYHARQWRKFKHSLQTDVEELSAKLRLMESGSPPAPTHHVYCNILQGKDALIVGPAAAAKKGLGNVYTQEKHPS